ncbi:MAG: HAMP domain-containing histidine kinase [bacterium]|nr:HAMP domain-containing histidine kinase [bacterium]
MKKIVRQQNYLKSLIESQGKRFLSKQTLKCLVRSALEALLDAPEDGVVLYRIDDKVGLQGLLKRLEFSEIKSINYSDDSKNIVEKVWANTEFLCVLTHRYVAIDIWDNNTNDENFVRYYSLYNSKFQDEALDIIKRNSKVDIAPYQATYRPDRRDNALMNYSLRKLLEHMEEASNDAVLGYAEKSAETLSDADYASKKSRVVAHEIKNQLSICDLYTEIIKRYLDKNDDNKENMKNAVEMISKSLKMVNNSLLELKTDGKPKLDNIKLSEVVYSAYELSKVYLEGKNIEFQIENNADANIFADSDKLIAVIINLVKNASEAFLPEELGVSNNGKYIKIKTEKNENAVVVSVSNNAPGIVEPDRIFHSGYTTKESGSGLGLWICKKSIEEQFGELELERSSEDFTEFVIRFGIAG